MSFDSKYKEQLLEHYPAEIVKQITDLQEEATLPHQAGQVIPYAHVLPLERKHERPILYVPGFGESITNKAAFAAELALKGYEVILPGQNRRGMLRNGRNKPDATYTQAQNYLAVAEAAAPDKSVDVVSHSYGSLIVDRMINESPECFANSRVVALAPAGSIEGETVPALLRRWKSYITAPVSERGPMEVPDPTNATGRASIRTLLTNIPRTISEIRDLAHEQVDYSKLAQKVGSLSVLSYAEDRLFPEDLLAPTIGKAILANEASNLSWSTPVRYPSDAHPEHLTYGGQGAMHDDEQYYPSRVAGAISQILK